MARWESRAPAATRRYRQLSPHAEKVVSFTRQLPATPADPHQAGSRSGSLQIHPASSTPQRHRLPAGTGRPLQPADAVREIEGVEPNKVEFLKMDSPEPRRFTYQDLEHFDPQRRWELIEGKPYSMAGASLLHQLVVGELYFALKSHFADSPCRVILAPFDVKFSEEDVVQPDLLISCNDRLRSQFQDGPPELVVEVLSPSTLRHDRLRKLNLYAREGVAEYWLVTPHPFLIEVLSNREGAFMTHGVFGAEHILRSAAFPELRLPLEPINAALPPQPPIEDEVRETVPSYE